MISDIIEALRLKSERIVVFVSIAGFLTFMIFLKTAGLIPYLCIMIMQLPGGFTVTVRVSVPLNGPSRYLIFSTHGNYNWDWDWSGILVDPGVAKCHLSTPGCSANLII